MNVFFGGQTVSFGNFKSDIGDVSTVVFTGLALQDLKDSLMIKIAAVNPPTTITLQINRV